VGCHRGEPNWGIEDDIKAIQELHQVYAQGVNIGDLDMFMSVWAEDAVRLESDVNYIVGKEKIKEHFRAPFEQFDIKITVYGDKEIKVERDLAYSHANFLLSLTSKGTDSTSHIDLKYLEIYERQDDGTWKIKVGSVISNPQWSDESLSPELLKSEDVSVPKL
jgi:uncharacterized protein (TIGR02246 family)